MVQLSVMPESWLGNVFPLGVFQFRLLPLETLYVPAINKANMLRGAFGHAFRRLCCVPQCGNARQCPVGSPCPYKNIFEPSPPPEAGRLSKNQDIPRPFVFRAPATGKTRFEPGEEFDFGLVLIGRALDYLPYFVLSFRALAAEGLGLNRAKCELKQVIEDDHHKGHRGEGEQVESSASGLKIFDSGDQVFHSPQGLSAEHWITYRVGQLQGRQSDLSRRAVDHRMTGSPDRQIYIRFLSPTWIKSENQIVQRPDFAHIFKRLRDRINALSTFFGSGPLDADFAGLGQRAQQVRTVACNVHWEERFRTSSKTRQRHELSGFIGEAVYEGELKEFLPWLILGELVHLGKHTAWGMGQIELGHV